MKKLFILLFVLGLSTPIFAQLDSKQVVGNWKYIIVTDAGDFTGVIKFVETEGKLTGNVFRSEGNTGPITKIELKEENILYFEAEPEYDVIKSSVKVDGKTFKGTVSFPQGDASITGVKVE